MLDGDVWMEKGMLELELSILVTGGVFGMAPADG